MKRALFLIVFLAVSCAAPQKKQEGKKNWAEDTFLSANPKNRLEVFRILMTSDCYILSQKGFAESISRLPDDTGDKYFSEEIKRLNKIDESREGVVSIVLNPDSGQLMKMRFIQSTYLRELDQLITDDVQRWAYSFPQKRVNPVSFNIHYKIVLQKTLSDEEIIREMRQEIKERTGQ